MRGKFQFSVSLSHSNADKQCVNNKKKLIKTKKRDALLHFKMRRVGMVVGVVEVCTVHERPCVVVHAFLKSLDRLLIREFIITLSAF